MPAAIAIPAIIGAAGVGVSAYGAHQAGKAGKLSPAEQAAQRTQFAASNALARQGSQFEAYGMPKLQQAGNYFSTLAGGNRAATSQMLAPETQNINSLYGGTQRTLSRFLTGPNRDYAMGELNRQRVGQLGSLFSGARARGVEGLVNLGQYGMNASTSAYGGAAGIAGSIGGAAMQNRYANADLQRQAGSDTAGLIFQLLRSGMFSGGGGGGSRIPNIPTTVGWPTTIPGTSTGGW